MTTTVATAVQVTLDPGKLNQENLLLVGAGWKELGIAGHGPESIKVIRKCFEAGRISKDGTVCMRRVRNGAHMEGSTTCLEELINDPSITYLVPTADTVDKCKIDGSVLTGRIYYRSNPNREWNPFPSINDIPEIVAQDPKLDAMLQNSKDSEHLVWMMKSNDYPCMPSLAAINLMRNDFWLHLINGESKCSIYLFSLPWPFASSLMASSLLCVFQLNTVAFLRRHMQFPKGSCSI
mgnify:CR=1 FL=1